LQWLNLGENRLTAVSFPQDMTNLLSLYLDDNRFTTTPALSSLVGLRALDLAINQLTTITIPHTLTNLWQLVVSFNPLQTIIVPDVIATDRLHQVSFMLDEVRAQGVTVYVYPVVPRLSGLTVANGTILRFVLSGPPGTHTLERTAGLDVWSVEGYLTNVIGTVEAAVPMSMPMQLLRTRLP
jgi:hypothetical protein